MGFHTQAVYHTMLKVWEDGASSGEVGTFFCEGLSTAVRQGLRTWSAVRNHHHRGISLDYGVSHESDEEQLCGR